MAGETMIEVRKRSNLNAGRAKSDGPQAQKEVKKMG